MEETLLKKLERINKQINTLFGTDSYTIRCEIYDICESLKQDEIYLQRDEILNELKVRMRRAEYPIYKKDSHSIDYDALEDKINSL